MEVSHLAGEELDIGAADTDPLDIDDDLAGLGGGWLDVPDLGLRGPVMTKALIRACGSPRTETCCRCSPSPSMPSVITSPGCNQMGGLNPRPTPGGVPVLIRSPGSSTMNWLR